MRKLLNDFKKKIQDSYYFYFYHIGSQKLGDKHLATISKWQDLLENYSNNLNNNNNNNNNSILNSNNKRIKRLVNHSSTNQFRNPVKQLKISNDMTNNSEKENNNKASFDLIPLDCKIEIMRRLNTGLDLVNLSKCNKSLNDIISQEIIIWKSLCQHHFHQAQLNSLLLTNSSALKLKLKKPSQNNISNSNQSQSQSSSSSSSSSSSTSSISDDDDNQVNDLDWKFIYFRLKKRYGHREVYANMIYKCFHCKCLFWKVKI
jgi:hypothetical protein